jgi:hypothetical protein
MLCKTGANEYNISMLGRVIEFVTVLLIIESLSFLNLHNDLR